MSSIGSGRNCSELECRPGAQCPELLCQIGTNRERERDREREPARADDDMHNPAPTREQRWSDGREGGMTGIPGSVEIRPSNTDRPPHLQVKSYCSYKCYETAAFIIFTGRTRGCPDLPACSDITARHSHCSHVVQLGSSSIIGISPGVLI